MVALSGWWSFCGDFGDGGAGAGFVDDGFLGGVGGDEGLDGEVVHRPWQASGDLVDQGERVVARAASLASRVRARPAGPFPVRPVVSAAVIGTPVPSTAM